jgi:hypothetical protein
VEKQHSLYWVIYNLDQRAKFDLTCPLVKQLHLESSTQQRHLFHKGLRMSKQRKLRPILFHRSNRMTVIQFPDGSFVLFKLTDINRIINCMVEALCYKPEGRRVEYR